MDGQVNCWKTPFPVKPLLTRVLSFFLKLIDLPVTDMDSRKNFIAQLLHHHVQLERCGNDRIREPNSAPGQTAVLFLPHTSCRELEAYPRGCSLLKLTRQSQHDDVIGCCCFSQHATSNVRGHKIMIVCANRGAYGCRLDKIPRSLTVDEARLPYRNWLWAKQPNPNAVSSALVLVLVIQLTSGSRTTKNTYSRRYV